MNHNIYGKIIRYHVENLFHQKKIYVYLRVPLDTYKKHKIYCGLIEANDFKDACLQVFDKISFYPHLFLTEMHNHPLIKKYIQKWKLIVGFTGQYIYPDGPIDPDDEKEMNILKFQFIMKTMLKSINRFSRIASSDIGRLHLYPYEFQLDIPKDIKLEEISQKILEAKSKIYYYVTLIHDTENPPRKKLIDDCIMANDRNDLYMKIFNSKSYFKDILLWEIENRGDHICKIDDSESICKYMERTTRHIPDTSLPTIHFMIIKKLNI